MEDTKYWREEKFITMKDKWEKVLQRYPECSIEVQPPNIPPVYNPPLKRHYCSFKVSAYYHTGSYYRICQQLIYHGDFKAYLMPTTGKGIRKRTELKGYTVKRIKAIWTMHANGLKNKEILDKYNKTHLKDPITMHVVKKTINHLRDTMFKDYLVSCIEEETEELVLLEADAEFKASIYEIFKEAQGNIPTKSSKCPDMEAQNE